MIEQLFLLSYNYLAYSLFERHVDILLHREKSRVRITREFFLTLDNKIRYK